MGTPDAIDLMCERYRAVVVEKITDCAAVGGWLEFDGEGDGAVGRLGERISQGTEAEFFAEETPDGFLLIATHYETGSLSYRELSLPFTVGSLEDAINELDDECGEPFDG